MSTTRLMIVSARYRLVQGLSLLLALEGGAEVVGWATAPEQALERVLDLCPDVVLLEHPLGESDGIELARRLRESPAPPRIVLTGADELGEDSTRARASGVVAWLPRDLPPDLLLDRIRAAISTGAAV